MTSDPSSILSFTVVYVEIACSPCDKFGFPWQLQFPPSVPKELLIGTLISCCKSPSGGWEEDQGGVDLRKNGIAVTAILV